MHRSATTHSQTAEISASGIATASMVMTLSSWLFHNDVFGGSVLQLYRTQYYRRVSDSYASCRVIPSDDHHPTQLKVTNNGESGCVLSDVPSLRETGDKLSTELVDSRGRTAVGRRCGYHYCLVVSRQSEELDVQSLHTTPAMSSLP